MQPDGMLTIHLTRVSDTHHRFEYVREDGTGEAVVLETRSLLFHDLLHFAVETEAGLKNSFYGLLERQASFADLRAESFEHYEELATTERVVGMLTGFLKSPLGAEQFLQRAAAMFGQMGHTVPDWLTAEFLLRVKERMRRLTGEWNALPFHRTMQLLFQTPLPAG